MILAVLITFAISFAATYLFANMLGLGAFVLLAYGVITILIIMTSKRW